MSMLEIAGKAAKITGEFIIKNAPTILTAIGIGGMVVSVFMATKEPVKVEEDLYELEKQEEKSADIQTTDVKHPVWPRIKIYVKHYWPTALVVVASAGCVLCANKILINQKAALLVLTATQANNIKDLKDKIIELDGKSKLKKIEDSIAVDKIKAYPPPKYAGGPQKDCYWILDTEAHRYMWGNKMMVDTAFNAIKSRLYGGEMLLDLNDLYDEMSSAGLNAENEIGVPHSKLASHSGFIDATEMPDPKISFDGWGGSDDGCPVMVISYDYKSLPY